MERDDGGGERKRVVAGGYERIEGGGKGVERG